MRLTRRGFMGALAALLPVGWMAKPKAPPVIYNISEGVSLVLTDGHIPIGPKHRAILTASHPDMIAAQDRYTAWLQAEVDRLYLVNNPRLEWDGEYRTTVKEFEDWRS